MPKSSKILLLTVSVVLVLAVFLGVNSTGVNAATDQDQGAYKQIDVYSEVLRHIQADYVVEPNIPKVTNGALRGLLESLDADSSYLTPAEYKMYKTEQPGKAQVGLNVSKRYGYATVVSVIPGSPADKANLDDGDIIEAIGDQDTRQMSLEVIRRAMAGAPGSELTLAVVRPRRTIPEKVTLTRVLPQVPAVSETLYENSSILYLKTDTIDHAHVQEIEQKLKGMKKDGSTKILLDLRDVASGTMPDAVHLANLFLKTGTIASLEGQRVSKQTFTADPSKAVNATAPMVVLVNRGTAGPAELVAGALLDDKRAQLVGERTFGEGAQQKTFELPDGGAVILSVAKYETPSGKKLQDDAVTPEVQVASVIADENEPGDDTATPGQALPAPRKPDNSVDQQLNKGLELLKSKAA